MLMHVFKRDLRRTKWFWAAMALTTTALCAVPHVAFARMDHGRGSDVVMSVFMLLTAAHVCASVALVRRLVAEDAPLRSTAFWRTRPLGAGAVLAAKVIYGVLLVVGAPVLVALPWAWGLESAVVWSGVRQLVLVQGVMLVIGLPVAVLSRRMLVGLAVVVGTYVALVMAEVWVFTPWALSHAAQFSFFKHDVLVTRVWLVLAMMAGATGWAVWRAYARGEQRAGLFAVAVALGSSVAVQAWWPWGWVPDAWAAPSSGSASARPEARAELEVKTTEGGIQVSTGLMAVVTRNAADERLWQLVRAETVLRVADGKQAMFYPGMSGAWRALGRGPALLGGADLPDWAKLPSNNATFPIWLEIVEPKRPVEWSGRLFFEEGRVRELAVPVTEGASAGAKGDRVRVRSVSVENEGIWVQVVEEAARELPNRINGMERLYLLVNDGRKEVLAEQPSGQVLPGIFVEASEWAMRFEIEKAELRDVAAWKVWLAGARLVRLTYEKTGCFSVDVGPFKVPEPMR